MKSRLFFALLLISVSIVNAKVLKIGSNIDNPPFEFYNDGGKAVGFDIDLITAMAKEAGYDVDIKDYQFSGLIPAVTAKKIDVAVSPITITEDRKKTVDFTDSHYLSGLTIMVRKDEKRINNLKDLEGKKIAVPLGSTSEALAGKIRNAILTRVDSEIFPFLTQKKVDAIIYDAPVNSYYIKTSKENNTKVVGDIMESEEYGFAVSKENTKLKNELNAALKKLRNNGTYAKIYEKWFGGK
jgi:polar amino acid transport system substrate-binding protein